MGQLVEYATERGRKTRPDLKVGICGEQVRIGQTSMTLHTHARAHTNILTHADTDVYSVPKPPLHGHRSGKVHWLVRVHVCVCDCVLCVQGGEPMTVAFCHGLGLDYVSCSPFRVPIARLAAAQAAVKAPWGEHKK